MQLHLFHCNRGPTLFHICYLFILLQIVDDIQYISVDIEYYKKEENCTILPGLVQGIVDNYSKHKLDSKRLKLVVFLLVKFIEKH